MKSLDGINKLEAQLSHNRPKSEIDGWVEVKVVG